MKKLLFVAIALIALNLNAQDKDVRFGFSIGVLNASYQAEFQNISTDENEIEFYGGLSLTIDLEEKFDIQGELLYFNNDVIDRLSLPVLGKYQVSKKIGFLFGPQVFINLEETASDFSSINFAMTAGISIDIDKNFSIQSRYAKQLNNSYTGDLDITSRIHYLNFGFLFKT